MKPQVAKSIKIVSTIFISGAIALECWNVYLHLHNSFFPTELTPVLKLASVALIAHGVEGFIAALNASPRDRNPFLYGIYTFFVGFVGLQELFENKAVD